jgi:glycosyltransferase involved in cell wall biosynthesis
MLPPRANEGRTRVLFLSSTAQGFLTYERELRKRTETRDDIDAVHIALVPNRMMKLIGIRVPGIGKWDYQPYRYMRMWSARISSWFDSVIDPARFDIVHVTTENNALALPALTKRTGIPYSVYIDATTTQFCGDFGYSRLTGAPVIAGERAIYGNAAFVACMSEWARSSVITDYGVDESRAVLVRSAVDLPALGEDRRPHAGLVKLVYVGNDWNRKGGGRILRWHQEHFADQAELHFIGRKLPAISGRNVIVHGAMDRDRLMDEILPSMDVFVLPTREDMTPWVIIEAQSLRLPVVSSRVGAIGEMVVHGETGLLAQRDDDATFIANIKRLIEDAALRRTMSLAARAHAEREFSPDRWYDALFERLKLAAQRGT